MKKSIFALSLSIALLTSILSPSFTAEAKSSSHLQKATSIKQLKNSLNDEELVIVDTEKVDLNDIVEELKIPLKVSSDDEDTELKMFAAVKKGKATIPIYVYSEDDLDEDTLDKLAKIIDDYKEELDVETEIDIEKEISGKAETLAAAGLAYSGRAEALKLEVTKTGGKKHFWYTEYRVYGSKPSSTTNYYYLRADHKMVEDKLLFGFKAQWYPGTTRMDLLDPSPKSKSNTNQITISIPLGISWQTDLVDDIDINTKFDIENDHAVWEVENYTITTGNQWMEDFAFTQGVHIESNKRNDGFSVNVKYEGWNNKIFNFNKSADWNIKDEIYYVESDDDLDFND